jgi:hypothetical protein
MKTRRMWLGLLAGLLLGIFPLASAMAGDVDIENKAGIQVSVSTRTAADSHTVYVDPGATGQEIYFKLNKITAINVGCEPPGKPFTVLKSYDVASPSMLKNYKVVVSGASEAVTEVTVTEICKYPVCP